MEEHERTFSPQKDTAWRPTVAFTFSHVDDCYCTNTRTGTKHTTWTRRKSREFTRDSDWSVVKSSLRAKATEIEVPTLPWKTLNYHPRKAWKERRERSSIYLTYLIIMFRTIVLAFGSLYQNIHRDHRAKVFWPRRKINRLTRKKSTQQWKPEPKNYEKIECHFISVQTAMRDK